MDAPDGRSSNGWMGSGKCTTPACARLSLGIALRSTHPRFDRPHEFGAKSGSNDPAQPGCRLCWGHLPIAGTAPIG